MTKTNRFINFAMYCCALLLFILMTNNLKAQSSALSWDFESNNIDDSFSHIGWGPTDCQATVANDLVTSGNKVLKVEINNYNAAPVLKYVLPAGKTLADYNSFTFKGNFAQGDVGYKTIVVEAYQTMPTAQFGNNTSVQIGSWARNQMGSSSWEDITVDIPNSSTFKDTIYIAFGINCAGTGDVGGAGSKTIWYADDITLVPKPAANTNSTFAVSKNSIDFGTNTVGVAKKQSVSISNPGTDTLKVTSISSTNALFTFSPSSFTVAPSDSSILDITFKPVDASNQSGFIIVTHNAEGSPDSISVMGKGLQGTTIIPLVTNGGFEDSSPGVVSDTQIDGWLIQVADGLTAAPVFEIIDSSAQNGNNALKVTVNSAGTNSWDIQIVADSIPAVPGQMYKYSVWAKSDIANSQIYFTVGNYAYSEYAADRASRLTTEWKEYTLEFTVNDNQAVIRAPIHFSLAANVGSNIYLDNMSITKVITQAEAFKPIIVEAEDGTVGSDFLIETDAADASLTYVTINTDAAAANATTNPATADRVISYQVTFPDSGTSSLYARINVGPDNFNDDSFFQGNSFGEKDPAIDSDWLFINGLAAAGFSDGEDIVREAGGIGSNVWKWVNLSENAYPTAGVKFIVDEAGSTYTFQIGGREDGLKIDKFAFGKSVVFYSVDNLDKGEAGVSDAPGTIYEGPPLAHKQDKFLGSAYGTAQAFNFESYWNKVTPENAGKWGSVEGTRDQMNWGALDIAYNFAKDNNFPFHFHVLIWGAQQPAWISTLTPEEQLEEIREWFEAVAQRYEDIDYLEVVNEPLLNHNPPDGTNGRANYKNALGGNGTTGYDWIINAFKMAREIFPAKTKLLLNDFSIVNSSTSTAEYLKIIRLLQKENLIDLIGEQGHAFTTTAAVATMKRNLDSLASTGIPIHITELDIDGSTDQIQLTQYKRIFPLFWEHPGVEGITLWGWRRGLWRDEQGAYLISSNNVERPALIWLREYLDSVVVSVEEELALPQNFELFNNYPNPFNPTTNIKYNVSKQSHVALRVYDVLGRVVKTLVNDMQSPGQYTVTFNANNLASGIYFYRLEAGDFVKTKKLILMK